MSNELKPGRELDALVAEKVMGWRRLSIPEFEIWEKDGLGRFHPGIKPFPNYSTDIAAAWEVVEKLKSSDFCLKKIVPMHEPNFYRCWMGSVGPFDSDTAPHAICLAALKVVGHVV